MELTEGHFFDNKKEYMHAPTEILQPAEKLSLALGNSSEDVCM